MDWNNVVSMVATADGLLVTERSVDGMVGAAPKVLRAMPTAERLVPGLYRDAVLDYGDPPLQTYRIVTCSWLEKSPGFDMSKLVDPLPANFFQTTCKAGPSFKSAVDSAVMPGIFVDAPPGATIVYPFVTKYCYRLERLDAKPGYVSAWTVVKNTCMYSHSGPPTP